MTTERITRSYMVLIGTYTLAASLIWSVNTLFLLESGLSITEVFLANAAFSAGMVIFEIPTGVVADTLGRRVSYLLSVVILAATTVLYLVAAQVGAGIVVFVVVSIFMGLGFTFYSGALEAWVVDGLHSVASERSLDSVFARGQQVSGSAMFVGTIIGGFLGQVDLALPFIARTAVLVIVFGVAFTLMHDMGFEPRPLSIGDIPAQMRKQAAVGIGAGWGDKSLRLLMISASVRGVFLGRAFYASQPYFLELLDRDAVWIVGLITAGASLATIAGNQIVELVSRRCARRTTMLIGAGAASSVSGIAIGLTSSFTLALVSLFVISAAMGVISPVRQAYLHAVTARENRATVVSFDAMVSSIGGVGGQVGLGAIADARSYSAGYVVGGATTALSLPVLWLLRRRGGAADILAPSSSDAGVDTSCPAGLPRVTGVEAVSVPVATGRSS